MLLLGGRSGVGKTSVAHEIHAQLAARQVRHCIVEGDNLDLAYPAPWAHGLAEKNLRAIWRNYVALGYSRLVLTNTVSVTMSDEIAEAMGDNPRVIGVLFTCSDRSTRDRLTRREIGSGLEVHLARSAQAALELDDVSPAWVSRVSAEDRAVEDVALEIIDITGWA